jgi:RimJ/RimL family protein N-acetyltransferase
MLIPRLETERLVLREFRADDFETYAEMLADPEVTRFIAPAPMNRADAWRSLSAAIGHWTLRGYGRWAVTRKSDGAFLGPVGMINPEGWLALEIGWTIGKQHWGKGYATEAAAAAMRYAFLTQPVDSLISCIDPENTPSQAVAMRLGETKGERHVIAMQSQNFPVDVWRISREEWLRRNAA